MQLTVPGPCGQLEAIYHPPRGGVEAPRAVAVVCHPHPRPEVVDPNTTHQGGNMHSTVTFKIARALQNAGLACVRINFRGVQGSDGQYDGHGGEEEDAAAGLAWLAQKHPGVPQWAAGFSFGSRTVFGLARRTPAIERLVLVGFPLRAYELDGVDRLTQPTLFVWGADDEFGALPDLREQYPHLPAHVEASEIPGADHFFMRFTKELESCVHAWAARAVGHPAS